MDQNLTPEKVLLQSRVVFEQYKRIIKDLQIENQVLKVKIQNL